MFKLKVLISIIAFVVLSVFSHAQNEANFWFFGENIGLDFTSGAPVAIGTGQIDNMEGTSCASDPVSGALLFYTDGKKVWDATHSVMPNGTGLLGGASSTMAALIVPQPGSTTIYYVFTTDDYQNSGINGFNYSIVDMSANSGLGDVVSKNNFLFGPCAEVNHAVKHANCTDYWIIAQDLTGNIYRTFLLTSSGLVTFPVLSSVGFNFTTPGFGTGKFSPNGKKFARAYGTSASDGNIQLFDFNCFTGKLSNPIKLFPFYPWYGVSFSPDNSKLYASAYSSIYQWDVSSEDSLVIESSKLLIASSERLPQLQIGNDNKIYIAGDYSTWLDRIDSPNSSGAACNFVDNAIVFPSLVHYGLPAFPESYFNQSPPEITVFEYYDTTIIYGMSAPIIIPAIGNLTWTPGTFLDCTTCNNPVVTPEEEIEYLIADDYYGYGCPIYKKYRIKVEYLPHIPNVFTPNGDGQNETLLISGLPPGSKLQIYNRWGTLLFQTNDYKNDWKTNVDGVYYYLLQVHEQEYKGFVQVLNK